MTFADDSSINAFLDLPELRAGELVDGKFLIVRHLGEGSFGRVYEAHDQRVGRRVALKTVYTTGRADQARRLRREIELLKGIEHANVVRLYDSGEDPGGILYMSMELVDGRELGEVLHDEGPFDTGRALRVTFQVLDALAEALRHDVVHLDLKPENIVLTAEGLRRDVVKLLDFGIAKSVQSRSQFGYAVATVAAGTPLYMAPEQVENRDIGPHTDVYAVALILLEMLTGRPVFVGHDALDVLTQKSHTRVTVPAEVAEAPLAAVLERALSTDHRKRYPSVLALYAALQEVLGACWGPQSVYVPLEAPAASAASERAVARPGVARPDSSDHAVAAFFAQLDTGQPAAPAVAPGPDAQHTRPRVRRTLEMSGDQLDALSDNFPAAQARSEFDDEEPTARFRKGAAAAAAVRREGAETPVEPVDALAALPAPLAELDETPPPPSGPSTARRLALPLVSILKRRRRK